MTLHVRKQRDAKHANSRPTRPDGGGRSSRQASFCPEKSTSCRGQHVKDKTRRNSLADRPFQPLLTATDLRPLTSRLSPDIDFPPRGGILVPYLRCETGHQPHGRRRIIRFRCRGPAASLSHAEMSFASGFLPSTTTDFLAPRGNCVHHADRDLQRLAVQSRDRKSVSPDRFSYSQHVTNCPVVRLATSARAAAALSHSLRTACVGATFA
jgi:hypothetical protein